MWKVLIFASGPAAGSSTVDDFFSETGGRLAEVSIVAYVRVASGRKAERVGASRRLAERSAAMVDADAGGDDSATAVTTFGKEWRV